MTLRAALSSCSRCLLERLFVDFIAKLNELRLILNLDSDLRYCFHDLSSGCVDMVGKTFANSSANLLLSSFPFVRTPVQMSRRANWPSYLRMFYIPWSQAASQENWNSDLLSNLPA